MMMAIVLMEEKLSRKTFAVFAGLRKKVSFVTIIDGNTICAETCDEPRNKPATS
jgi:hypothetical protein